MRLTQQQVQGLITALSSFIDKRTAQLRLYGSRVDDTLKGGDIDLLLLMDDKIAVQELQQQKHYMLSAMKKNIGDQKIDFKITTQQECNEDSFLKMIMPNSIILHSWGN